MTPLWEPEIQTEPLPDWFAAAPSLCLRRDPRFHLLI